MKILVTGGAGFIGSHLVEALLSQKMTVVVLDNLDPFYDPRVKERNIEPYRGSRFFKFVKGDIRNRETLSRLFSRHRFDACVHLAARAGVRPSIQDPYLYHQVNVEGTLNLLEEARRHRLGHFIFGSSSSVYGRRKGAPFSEKDALLSPISPYAATKIAGESLCHVYHELYGMRITVLRFFTVYGPRQRPEMAVHQFTRAIHQGRPIRLFGNGRSRRDYTYVSDIVDGIMAALTREFVYEVINLGNSKAIPLIQLVRCLQTHLGTRAKISWMKDQPGDVPLTCADISKARRLLGYRPKVEMEEGIEKFCRWFLQSRDS